MQKNILNLLLVLACFGFCDIAEAASVSFTGLSETAVEVQADNNSGLDAVYVLPSAPSTVRMVYNSTSNAIRWYRFSNLGTAYAEEIEARRDGSSWSVALQDDDCGYMIEDNGSRHCYWVADYSKHMLRLESLEASAEQECDRTILLFTGSAEGIPFYSVTGRRLTMARDLELRFSNQKYDEESFSYVTAEESLTLDEARSTISIPAVYTATDFTLSGDRFLRTWGREESLSSGIVEPTGTSCESRATQTVRDNDNEQRVDAALGGSAPCEISFEAIKTDAAMFYEWQISRSPEFDIIENSYTALDFDYTFYDSGSTYVRFVVNNAAGTCEYSGPAYEVFIGESKLEIPNAFSPTSSPGVNDEWKVSYKSLTSYECHIFNRWGTKLFSSTNPAEGWDGKYRGKFVPSGVYYYVIKAEGADGIKYERAGDINIIDFKSSGSSQTTE